MNRISQAITEIYKIHRECEIDRWINNINPIVKLFLTIIYILILISFDKYDLSGVCSMILYPLITMIMFDISVKDCKKRLKSLFVIICAVGIINPFIDHKVVKEVCGVMIIGGVISMITLMIKGILAVMASYILIVTTSIEKICCALRVMHVPKIFITIILLIYRYIVLLLKETEKIINAYELRAPGQKGVNFKVWGSLVGMLMLRSMERAEDVYESMLLRGYEGEYYTADIEKSHFIQSFLYFTIWLTVIILCRIIHIKIHQQRELC